MQATLPHLDVIVGDSPDSIMSRSADLVGMTDKHAIWRFGFLPHSEAATAYGCAISDGEGFVWVLATRRTGKVLDTCRGYALDLPARFRRVIDGSR